MDPIAEGGVDERMFVVPLRGADDRHVDCFIGGDNDGDSGCYPPILELDPSTGRTIKIINGASPGFFFSTFRHGWLDIPIEQRIMCKVNQLLAALTQDARRGVTATGIRLLRL